MAQDLIEFFGDSEQAAGDKPLGWENMRVLEILLKGLDNHLNAFERSNRTILRLLIIQFSDGIFQFLLLNHCSQYLLSKLYQYNTNINTKNISTNIMTLKLTVYYRYQIQMRSKPASQQRLSTHQHHQHESSDEDVCDFQDKQLNEFIAYDGKIGKICKPYPTKKVRTREDLLPLRIKMMRDYAKSKANNEGEVYYKLKSRQQELADSCLRKLEHDRSRPLYENSKEQSMQSSRAQSKCINLSRNKKTSPSKCSPKTRNKKSLQDIVINNNEYFHRINQNVMDRLLGIIQNKQAATTNHQHKNPINYARAGENSTKHHSLADSRHIVIHNILPGRDMAGNTIDSKMKYTEQKVQKLYSQRKTFSYATPKGIKQSIQPIIHTQVQNLMSDSKNYISLQDKFQHQSKTQNIQNRLENNFQSENQRIRHIQPNFISLNDYQKPTGPHSREREFKKQRKTNKIEKEEESQNIQIRHQKRVGTHHQSQFADLSQPTYRTEHNILLEQPLTNRTQMNKNQQPRSIMMRFNKNNNNSSFEESKLIMPSFNSQFAKDKTPDQKITKPESKENTEQVYIKPPVLLEIPIGDDDGTKPNQALSLADAFKRKIGKLSSQQMPKKERQPRKEVLVSPCARKNATKHRKIEKGSHTNLESQKQNLSKPNLNLIDLNCSMSKSIKGMSSAMVTPKSSQPSQDLLNRLIGGSKAKISKKQMYALTKKNYENLPQVVEKKKLILKKQLEKQRIQRIKQYQKSIRASKTTIASMQ